MKSFTKKMCVYLSVALLVCSCFSASLYVSAAECNDFTKNTENVQTENLLSPAELQANGFHGRYVHSASEELSISSSNTTRAIPGVSRYANILNVPVVTQKNGHYCGPATVIQNLKYISNNQFNMTQDEVAEAIGTTDDGSSSSNMTPFMNRQIADNGYSNYVYTKIDIDSATFNEAFYVDTIYSNCRYYDWPAYGSFHLQTNVGYNNTTYKWPYSTSGGHFLSYSGIDITDDYNDIRFTDSYYLRKFPQASEYQAHYWVRAPICLQTILSFIW